MSPLSGKLVLVIEGEDLLGDDLGQAIEDAGAVVVGPFSFPEKAMAALDLKLDLAVLNVMIRQGTTYPIATTLRERGIPIVFATGLEMRTEPKEWHSPRWITKPYGKAQVIAVLEGALLGAAIDSLAKAHNLI